MWDILSFYQFATTQYTTNFYVHIIKYHFTWGIVNWMTMTTVQLDLKFRQLFTFDNSIPTGALVLFSIGLALIKSNT